MILISSHFSYQASFSSLFDGLVRQQLWNIFWEGIFLLLSDLLTKFNGHLCENGSNLFFIFHFFTFVSLQFSPWTHFVLNGRRMGGEKNIHGSTEHDMSARKSTKFTFGWVKLTTRKGDR
jgi:hypothetical protein